jgi:hypothetical protein
MHLYKRPNHNGSKTFYYSGAGEVVAIVRRKDGGQFWIRDTYKTQISAAGASEHATRAGAEGAAENDFEIHEL